MKTLKTITSVLILALAIAGAAQADDRPAGGGGNGGGDIIVWDIVESVTQETNSASNHTGGVNVLMADGSVKFMSSTVQSASDNSANIINVAAQDDDLKADNVR